MRVRILGAAVAGVLLLTGCTATRPPAAVAPTVAVPAGDAALTRFTAAAEGVVQRHRDPGGMRFIRALEAAGWARDDLQVTSDRTSVGLAVPSVQFAARDGDSCLLGQYGDGGLRTRRAEPVDGACLIGVARAPG